MNTLKIKILDKELTIKEARELFNELKNIFEPYNKAPNYIMNELFKSTPTTIPTTGIFN